jgi:hypothetical protein
MDALRKHFDRERGVMLNAIGKRSKKGKTPKVLKQQKATEESLMNLKPEQRDDVLRAYIDACRFFQCVNFEITYAWYTERSVYLCLGILE